MAVLTGISGLQIGDAEGGKIALDIDRRVLRILSGGRHSFLTATIPNLDNLRTGTIWFDRPEIIQNVDYNPAGDTSTTGFDVPQSGKVSINIDKRRQAKYIYEDFDVSRLDNWEYILGMIANGTAQAIEAQLNAEFLMFLVTFFNSSTAVDGVVGNKRVTELSNLFKGSDADVTPEQARADLRKLKLKQAELSKIYSKKELGVLQSEFITIVSPEAQVNLEQAFWDQQGSLSMILGREEYNKYGQVLTIIDNMLQNKIDANTSFAKDRALDTTAYGAIMIHNEAIAMPFNYIGTKYMLDNINANPKTITKYQYGIGWIRPNLVWAFKKAVGK